MASLKAFEIQPKVRQVFIKVKITGPIEPKGLSISVG